MGSRQGVWLALTALVLGAGCNGLLGNDVGRLAPQEGGVGGAGTGGAGATGGTAGNGGTGAVLGDAGPDSTTPALGLTPASHDFGNTGVGQKSSVADFTLDNSGTTGTGSLQVGFVGTGAGDFAQTNDCGSSLGPGASCTIHVSVTPSALGQLAVTLHAAASPGGSASTALTVTGTEAYAPLDTASRWQVFDTTKVDATAQKFEGSAFDGRYVYLVPKQGKVARFDTQATFNNAGSWKAFDTALINGSTLAMESAVFDGKYVYFVPTYAGTITRFDTTGSFTATSSWSSFDVSGYDPGAKGFIGAAFDGHYVYFAPFNNGSYDGVVTRYDTTGGFTTVNSWSTFNATSVNANAVGFVGTVFDGRYVYFAPRQSTVLRYDTQAGFSTLGAWTTFDLGKVDTAAGGFTGGAFDGRYVYFIPYRSAGGGYGGVVARLDTQAQNAFTSPASWTTFDTTSIDPNARGFVGATFDGRYLYLDPYYDSIYDGLVTRFDTTASFSNPASWKTYDVTNIDSGAKGFAGSAFDGRYVYFVPGINSSVTRFDAKQPKSMPRLCPKNAPALYCFSGSFL